MVKPLTKVNIQPGSSVLCEQGENIEWFRVNEKSGQIYPFVLFGFYLVVALGGFTVSKGPSSNFRLETFCRQ